MIELEEKASRGTSSEASLGTSSKASRGWRAGKELTTLIKYSILYLGRIKYDSGFLYRPSAKSKDIS